MHDACIMPAHLYNTACMQAPAYCTGFATQSSASPANILVLTLHVQKPLTHISPAVPLHTFCAFVDAALSLRSRQPSDLQQHVIMRVLQVRHL
jgi:hypothetical protein